MPRAPGGPDGIMRGLFGSMVASAAAGQTTQEVWQSFRSAMSSWARELLGVTLGRAATDAEVAAKVSEASRGIDAIVMNRWRAEAGRWVRAQRNLESTIPGTSIGGDAVFRRNPELWGGEVVPSGRMRLRVRYRYEFAGGIGEEWSAFSLESPLTSVEDIRQAAEEQFYSRRYNASARMLDWLDYNIEAI